MDSSIITIAANFIFAYYVCGTDHFHGCSTQIVPQEKIYSRRKYKVYAFLDDCINCVRDVDDILCKQCECVIGRAIEGSRRVSIKLFNVRLMEFRPMQTGVGISQNMMMNRSIDISNHLKRKSNSAADKDEPLSKYHRSNNIEPFCLMRVSLPTTDITPLFTMPELDLEDLSDDVDDFVDDMDIDLNNVIPLSSSSFLFEISDIRNRFTSLPPIMEYEDGNNETVSDFDSLIDENSDDSDVEFVPYTPGSPPTDNEVADYVTPSNDLNDKYLEAFDIQLDSPISPPNDIYGDVDLMPLISDNNRRKSVVFQSRRD